MSHQVNWEIEALDQAAGFLRDDPFVLLRSGTLSASSPMSRGRRSRSLTGRQICCAFGPGVTASSTQSMKNGGKSRSTTSPAYRSPGIIKPSVDGNVL